MENLARPSHDGVIEEATDAVAKIESRWRKAVEKAAHRVVDSEQVIAFDAQRSQEIAPRSAQPASAGTWSPVRSAQLRKLDSQTVRQQRQWLVPVISGEFLHEGEPVSWRLVQAQPIAQPVTLRLGDQPMQPEPAENASGSSDRGEAANASCELAIASNSFLLNWITVPWSSLAIEAKQALVLVGLQSLVESLGLAMNHHWQISALMAESADDEPVSPVKAAPVALGIEFWQNGVAHTETATLQIPEELLQRFVAFRRATRPAFSVARLIADRPELAQVAIRLPVVIGELSLALCAISELAYGDVIFFAEQSGGANDCWHALSANARVKIPGGRIDVRFDENKKSVTVHRVHPSRAAIEPADYDPFFLRSETVMQSNTSSNGAARSTDMSTSAHLAELPVSISVEVAELMLPLHALSELTVGNTLPLQKPLNEQLLTIRANSHVVAFGELVMLDGEVGVRIRRLVSSTSAHRAAQPDGAAVEAPSEAGLPPEGATAN